MSQLNNLEQQIANLQAEKSVLETAQDHLTTNDHWLSEATKNFDNLVHTNKIYGQAYHVSFKASPELLATILKELENDNLFLTPSTGGRGFYSYKQLANLEGCKNIILKKDNTAKFHGQFEVLEQFSLSGYSLVFFTDVSGKNVKVSIDFMGLIISENYSTKARGFEIPHLVENSYYTLDGKHGSKYLGKHGAYGTNSDLGYSHGLPSLSDAIKGLEVL